MKTVWDEVANIEETDRDDEAINRAFRWREIERHLEGVETVLDIGAGTGAFSIPLAERGYRVTHFDISGEMIARARARAGSLPIDFVEGDAKQITLRADLVLAFDGAISFAGRDAGAVLAAACAATRKTLIVTVSHRAAMVATWLKDSLNTTGGIHPAVHEMLRTGLWDADAWPELHPDPIWFPRFKAFTLEELRAELAANGMRVETLRSLGSLSHLMLPQGATLPLDEKMLALCERFDIELGGAGSFRRAGILAVASQSGDASGQLGGGK